jgi:hypothetical protein
MANYIFCGSAKKIKTSVGLRIGCHFYFICFISHNLFSLSLFVSHCYCLGGLCRIVGNVPHAGNVQFTSNFLIHQKLFIAYCLHAVRCWFYFDLLSIKPVPGLVRVPFKSWYSLKEWIIALMPRRDRSLLFILVYWYKNYFQEFLFVCFHC